MVRDEQIHTGGSAPYPNSIEEEKRNQWRELDKLRKQLSRTKGVPASQRHGGSMSWIRGIVGEPAKKE